MFTQLRGFPPFQPNFYVICWYTFCRNLNHPVITLSRTGPMKTMIGQVPAHMSISVKTPLRQARQSRYPQNCGLDSVCPVFTLVLVLVGSEHVSPICSLGILLDKMMSPLPCPSIASPIAKMMTTMMQSHVLLHLLCTIMIGMLRLRNHMTCQQGKVCCPYHV